MNKGFHSGGVPFFLVAVKIRILQSAVNERFHTLSRKGSIYGGSIEKVYLCIKGNSKIYAIMKTLFMQQLFLSHL